MPNDSAKRLRELISDIYYNENRITVLLQQVGLSRRDIPWAETTNLTWWSVFEELKNRLLFDKLLQEVLKDPQATTIHKYISEYTSKTSSSIHANHITTPIIIENEAELEKILGEKSTILNISFLTKGLECARSVARITMTFPNEPGCRYLGTAFLIGRDLILTNHHNLFSNNHKAESLNILFDYDANEQSDNHGLTVDLQQVWANSQIDAAVIKLSSPVERPPLMFRGLNASNNERVVIIQHPKGEHKQIAFGVVSYVDETVTQYAVDTQEGSSGSPVFDEYWKVVALHHAGGNMTQPSTGIISRINEGITVNAIHNWLRLQGFEQNPDSGWSAPLLNSI